MEPSPRARLAVDIGGTFTDVVLERPGGVQDLGCSLFVFRVDEGVQIADRHAFDGVLVKQRQRRLHR